MGWSFKKGIAKFEINIPDFFPKAKFRAKMKILNLGPKMPDSGVLGNGLEKILTYLESAP